MASRSASDPFPTTASPGTGRHDARRRGLRLPRGASRILRPRYLMVAQLLHELGRDPDATGSPPESPPRARRTGCTPPASSKDARGRYDRSASASTGRPVAPRDAATVSRARDGDGGPRCSSSDATLASRVGGAYVFPGGRLDPRGLRPRRPVRPRRRRSRPPPGEDDAARACGLHVAAIREALESRHPPSPVGTVADETAASLRRALEGRYARAHRPRPRRRRHPLPRASSLSLLGHPEARDAPFRRASSSPARLNAPGTPPTTGRRDRRQRVALPRGPSRARAPPRDRPRAPTWRTLPRSACAWSMKDRPAALTTIEPDCRARRRRHVLCCLNHGELATRFRYDDGLLDAPSVPIILPPRGLSGRGEA